MSRCKCILLSKSIVWMTDGVETERIPRKPEYEILNDYVGCSDSSDLFEGEKVEIFDPFEGLSNTCNQAVVTGISEQQVFDFLTEEEYNVCADLIKKLIHALMSMHADFLEEYCNKAVEEQNKLDYV